MFNFKEQDIMVDLLSEDQGMLSFYQIDRIWVVDNIIKFTAHEIIRKHNDIIIFANGITRLSKLFCESNLHDFKRFSLPSVEDMAIINKFLVFR